jgi:acyl carrier protein
LKQSLDTGNTAPSGSFHQQLSAAQPSERRGLIEEHVKTQVGNVLGLPAGENIEYEAGFFDQGMDSLTSLELHKRLQRSFKCTLSPTLAFQFPTVKELCDHLCGDVLNIETAPVSIDGTHEETALEEEALFELSGLDDDELVSFINREFKEFL